MSGFARIYTGLTGLPASKRPLQELTKIYDKLLRHLDTLPKESTYRQQTEQLINGRKQIISTYNDPLEVEKRIGAGMCEEMIEDAKLELKLVKTMEKYKPWEPLTEMPPENQWKWPV